MQSAERAILQSRITIKAKRNYTQYRKVSDPSLQRTRAQRIATFCIRAQQGLPLT